MISQIFARRAEVIKLSGMIYRRKTGLRLSNIKRLRAVIIGLNIINLSKVLTEQASTGIFQTILPVISRIIAYLIGYNLHLFLAASFLFTTCYITCMARRFPY